MRSVLLALCLCAGSLASPEPEPNREMVDTERPRYWKDERRHSLVSWVDPLRGVITHGGNPHDIALQNKIVRDVYSPVYYQPTLVVDYRYLKTGRAYTRGLGGQVLILPAGVKDPQGHGQSYDRLLEHLKEEEHKEIPKEELPYGRREGVREPIWLGGPEREREIEIPERVVERSFEKIPIWKGQIPASLLSREIYGK